jgi:hypothetical protein
MAGIIHVLLLQNPHGRICLLLAEMGSPLQLNTWSMSWNKNHKLQFNVEVKRKEEKKFGKTDITLHS